MRGRAWAMTGSSRPWSGYFDPHARAVARNHQQYVARTVPNGVGHQFGDQEARVVQLLGRQVRARVRDEATSVSDHDQVGPQHPGARPAGSHVQGTPG